MAFARSKLKRIDRMPRCRSGELLYVLGGGDVPKRKLFYFCMAERDMFCRCRDYQYVRAINNIDPQDSLANNNYCRCYQLAAISSLISSVSLRFIANDIRIIKAERSEQLRGRAARKFSRRNHLP